MFRKALLFVVLVCLYCFSCKKKHSTVDKHSVRPPKSLDTLIGLTAKVNGIPYQTDSVVGYKVNYSSDSGKFDRLVRATVMQGNSANIISFIVNNYSGLNTYYVSPPYNSATYYSGSLRYFASSGTITVTSDSDYGIIGNFSFTADTITVTEGVFNVEQP